MRILKSSYLQIIIISVLINLILLSISFYSISRIASSGIISLIDFMNLEHLNIDSESDCINYLKGRQFISDNGRGLEFDYQVRGYITYKGNNKTICAGYFEIGKVVRYDEKEPSEYRNFKINNNFTGRSSMAFELKRDGTMSEFGGGTYYPVR